MSPRLAVAVLSVSLCSAVAATAANSPVRVFKDYVQEFAVDGTSVAVPAVAGKHDCEVASVWNRATGKSTRLPIPRSAVCAYDWGGTESQGVAIAGDRVAWLAHGYSIEGTGLGLFTGRVGSHTATDVAWADGHNASGDDADFANREIGLLAGRDSTIAYLTWTIAPHNTGVLVERVWRIGTNAKPVLLGDVQDARALAVDQNLVAVVQGDRQVVFFDTRDGSRRAVQLTGATTPMLDRRDYDLGLTQGRLVLLTTTTIETYDAATGALLSAWDVPSRDASVRGLIDARGDYASYLVRNRIHVRRLSDGAEMVVPPARVQAVGCNGAAWARLAADALVYSSSFVDKRGCRTSRIGSIPLAELSGLFPG
jgi:hypothetical protein